MVSATSKMSAVGIESLWVLSDTHGMAQVISHMTTLFAAAHSTACGRQIKAATSPQARRRRKEMVRGLGPTYASSILERGVRIRRRTSGHLPPSLCLFATLSRRDGDHTPNGSTISQNSYNSLYSKPRKDKASRRDKMIKRGTLMGTAIGRRHRQYHHAYGHHPNSKGQSSGSIQHTVVFGGGLAHPLNVINLAHHSQSGTGCFCHLCRRFPPTMSLSSSQSPSFVRLPYRTLLSLDFHRVYFMISMILSPPRTQLSLPILSYVSLSLLHVLLNGDDQSLYPSMSLYRDLSRSLSV